MDKYLVASDEVDEKEEDKGKVKYSEIRKNLTQMIASAEGSNES